MKKKGGFIIGRRFKKEFRKQLRMIIIIAWASQLRLLGGKLFLIFLNQLFNQFSILAIVLLQA